MKISMRPLLATLVVSAGALLMVNSAQAGCGIAPPVFKVPMLKPNAWRPSTQLTPALRSADYHSGTDGRFVLSSDDGGWPGEAAIVGMWRFQLAGITGLPPGGKSYTI